ncbi:MAG: cobyrinate a,c-diamide synthase, partial [Acidobacteria bacterium]|nr:cobyrinate a,c-diamide synthase [Acidobacteriota bacterium]
MFSRIVIGGLAGDSGKTLVSLALVLAARERGRDVAAFKKGPDYIDAAWLTWASGRPARNLDTFLMGRDAVAASFERHASAHGVNIIEGNRGLHDGIDADGTHSTAALARLLGAPVLLVVSAAKATRTVAALVLGCQTLEPDVEIAGVILNRIGSPRHEAVIREAVASVCGIPVLGSLPRFSPGTLVPGRHLGLVTPSEHAGLDELRAMLIEQVARRLDVDAILGISRGETTRRTSRAEGRRDPAGKRDTCPAAVGPASRRSTAPASRRPTRATPVGSPDGRDLRIGYLEDAAFTFYYPENLEALEAAGTTLVPFSAVSGGTLPADLHALYIGGGFPETHAVALSRNTV